MSKRSYTDFASHDVAPVSKILEHAEDLLRAVKALKKELDTFRDAPEVNDQIASILQRHNKKILSSAQLLTQDGTITVNRHEPESHKIQKLDGDGKKHDNMHMALIIPPLVSLTRWTLDDIPSSGLPPLPPILDPTLEQAALTHSGMTTRPTDMSYERLEWIGDAYLYLMSTSFIYQTFTNLSPGRCSQLRERLIKNGTLSSYTIQYGINKRTKFPAEFDLHGRIGGSQASQNAKKKVLGDVFESYVAAAILGDSEGLSRVSLWIKSLWSTTIAQEIREECKIQPRLTHDHSKTGNNDDSQKPAKQDLNPKVQLSQVIGAKGVRIAYNDVGEPKMDKVSGKLPWYTVGVFFDGFGEKNLQLGIGGALSKKEAGANAARAALENKNLIKRLQKKKEESLKLAKSAESTQQEYDNWS
ncbi:ribonuclease III [Annulohypoxylon maeteangense]|uniref:ribonuclease III n=1 Tax=Annulohypoxylon maeteangense TaxID=1927788 RepID=UPI002007DCA2|nr:ribonuclease III [Annulohypoxylon maeteangense]KAI0884791.1 ribonuclease III [Annulohypoxylon maeteangense]